MKSPPYAREGRTCSDRMRDCFVRGRHHGRVGLPARPKTAWRQRTREALRQDSTWTSENIAKNPYLFLQEQIANCDRLSRSELNLAITFLKTGLTLRVDLK